MGKKLGNAQHLAWAAFITRHAKVFRLIERDLEGQESLLPLHLYDVLLALKQSPSGRLRLNEIAEAIVTSKSALSRSVEKLRKLGFLTKEQAEEDGRGQFAEITNEGRNALAATWPSYEAAIQQHFGARFTTEEAKLLISLLHKLNGAE